MGRFIREELNTQQSINNTNKIKRGNISKEMYNKVKKLEFQNYFDTIIVPQLPGYFDNYPVQFNYKPVVCCPLHDEDTPSFRFYEETNSFYCFGCQIGGDIIELHRNFVGRMSGTKPDRDDTVQFLYNYFIKGKELVALANTDQVNKEKLNSDSDIVKLNLYRIDLEQSISFDNSISLDDKKKIWEVLDNIDILISQNLIKAEEAKKFIKNTVKGLIEHKIKEQYKINYSKIKGE